MLRAGPPLVWRCRPSTSSSRSPDGVIGELAYAASSSIGSTASASTPKRWPETSTE